MESLRRKSEVVRTLELTDLALFTDARYTRHPSMADLNTAFQDYPMAFDYFPSGSIVAPPSHLRGEKQNVSVGDSVSKNHKSSNWHRHRHHHSPFD
ncbi:MAG: hypothetical protein N2509_00980 [Treponemataceae bacterium]|nr:hypothetical protein [Treponemataceae bacterium]